MAPLCVTCHGVEAGSLLVVMDASGQRIVLVDRGLECRRYLSVSGRGLDLGDMVGYILEIPCCNLYYTELYSDQRAYSRGTRAYKVVYGSRSVDGGIWSDIFIYYTAQAGEAVSRGESEEAVRLIETMVVIWCQVRRDGFGGSRKTTMGQVNRGTMLGHEASTFSFKVLGHEVLPLGVK